MSQFPNTTVFPSHFNANITSYSQTNLVGVGKGAQTSAIWPTASKAIFIPFRITSPIVFTTLRFFNGAAVSGNIDVGIYSRDAIRLISAGGAAQAGTSGYQSFTVASTQLGVGAYYFAAVIDNTTGTYQGTTVATAGMLTGLGYAEMASAYPLPATATLASISSTAMPLIGIQGRSFL